VLSWQIKRLLTEKLPSLNNDKTHLPIASGEVFDIRLEQARTRNYNAEALRARRGHIQTIGAIQKLHSPGSVGVERGRHRIDHNRSLLALKLVNCANSPTRYSLLKLEDLRVVRRNDQNVFKRNLSFNALSINPRRP